MSLFRLLLFWACVAACTATSTAQNVINEKTATVVSYWSVGDARSYLMERRKSGNRDAHTSVMLDVKVLAVTETSNTIEVRYRDMKALGGLPGDPKARRAAERVMKMVDGMRVVVTTSETGVVNEVTNGEELKRHCDKIIGEIASMGTTGQEKKEVEQVMRKVITVDALEMTALEDIGLLLYTFGVEYTLGEEQQGDTELQSPIGGDPLPAKVSIRMTKLDAAQQTCSIHVEQHIDPAKVMSIMDAGAGKTGTTMSAEDRAGLEAVVRTMKVDDVHDVDLDLAGAWVTKAVCTRTVLVEGATVVDQRTFTQL